MMTSVIHHIHRPTTGNDFNKISHTMYMFQFVITSNKDIHKTFDIKNGKSISKQNVIHSTFY